MPFEQVSDRDQGVPHRSRRSRKADEFIAALKQKAKIEVLDLNEEVLAAAADALARGEAVALVTVVRANGSTPQRAGAKMLVFADGRTVGTIGGGCYENDAFWKAREAIATGRGRRSSTTSSTTTSRRRTG